MTTTNRMNLVRYDVKRFYFFRKHYGVLPTPSLRPIMFVGSVARAIVYRGLYLLTLKLRDLAQSKLKACGNLVRLSLSPRPYGLQTRLRKPAAA